MEINKQSPFFLNEPVSQSWETKLSLKDRIQYLLLQRGMTQNDLADAIGVNKGTISKVVHEEWVPTSKIKILMAKKLEVDSLIIFGPKQYFLDYVKSFKKNEDKNATKSTN